MIFFLVKGKCYEIIIDMCNLTILERTELCPVIGLKRENTYNILCMYMTHDHKRSSAGQTNCFLFTV